MQFYPLVRGKKIPEIYHFGFNGTHFQIFVSFEFWSLFVELAGKKARYFSMNGPEYVPPTISGGEFGHHGCSNTEEIVGSSMCIKIPAFIEKDDDREQGFSIKDLGFTLLSVLDILRHLLFDVEERNEEPTQNNLQLFELETFISDGPGFRYSAGLELSLSPSSRKYLEMLGQNIILDKATDLMRAHMLKMFPSREGSSFLHSYPRITLRERGVLGLVTEGNCACLGTAPDSFRDDEGCYLTSHNIDHISQQFNLLVGVASVWQMVRSGLVVAPKKT